MTLAVMVPTFRRPDDLHRCITAIAGQTRGADQIVVVARRDDEPTRAALTAMVEAGYLLDIVLVDRPGLMHAMNSGLRAVVSDVVAITDDDAAPHPDWLEKIEQAFRSGSRVGGVGGRDRLGGKEANPAERRGTVGKVQWFGRVIGNHHLGCGPPRRVDVLKGVNCAYHVDALREVGFDERLKGAGAQFHFELGLGFHLIENGWTLIYDPDILVDHYPAQRHDYNQRGVFNAQAIFNEVHNETRILLEHLPPLRRAAFTAWLILCGTRSYPGLLCALVNALQGEQSVFGRPLATLRGRIAGIASWRSERAEQPVATARPPGHTTPPGVGSMTVSASGRK